MSRVIPQPTLNTSSPTAPLKTQSSATSITKPHVLEAKSSTSPIKVLFVSQLHGFQPSEKNHCGVGICGKLISDTFANWKLYDVETLFTNNTSDVEAKIATLKPVVILYNFHTTTTSWLQDPTMRLKYPGIVHIMINYDVTQRHVDAFNPRNYFGFTYVISDDDTLQGTDNVLVTNRVLPSPPKSLGALSDIPIIGFQGFGLKHKGIARLAERVQQEFDTAILNLHIPFSHYLDPEGVLARAAVEQVRSIIRKPGIQVRVNHKFLNSEELVEFLSKNTINCYFYDYLDGWGVASSPNFALAARRPIAVTRSYQLRNFWNVTPSVCIEHSSLKTIIANGIAPLEPLHRKYSRENVLRDYDAILRRFVCELDGKPDTTFHGDPKRHHWMFAYPEGHPYAHYNAWDYTTSDIRNACSNAEFISASDTRRGKAHETWRCNGHHGSLLTRAPEMKKSPGSALDSHSQAGQDCFVYRVLENLEQGTFLDIGSGEPTGYSSNTYALEQLGWNGVCMDILPLSAEYQAKRKCKFLSADATKIDWNALLANESVLNGGVDYLSLDIDEPTLIALRRMPFDRLKFRAITIEHDAYRLGNDIKNQMRQILRSHGYDLLCGDVKVWTGLNFEDWWVDPRQVNMSIANQLRSDGRHWTQILGLQPHNRT